LSTGIITATGQRSPGVAVRLLQTDGHGSRGGAGAPLADEAGRLVGIILGIQSAEPAGGITFAVPGRFVAELLEARPSSELNIIQRAYLGVQLETAEGDEGAKIVQVMEDTPAAAAGLQEGETIVAVNEQKVQTAENLSALIGEQPAGAKVTLSVRRDGEDHPLEVTLGKAPDAAAPAEAELADLAIELAQPGHYRVVPLIDPAIGQAADAQSVTQALSQLLQRQQPRSTRDPQPQPADIYKRKTATPDTSGLTPLTIYVQRSETDRRLDELAEEVKALRKEVKELADQLKAAAERQPGKSELMTREQALQSLREEFLKKLDDLVRQQQTPRE
jgi:hypothetical protein